MTNSDRTRLPKLRTLLVSFIKTRRVSFDVALSQHCGAIETRRVSEGEARRPLNDTDLYSAIVASNGEFLGTSPR